MKKQLGIPQPDSDVVNKQPKVLLIGYGWVGQYMGKYFTDAHIVESDGIIKSQDGIEVEPHGLYDLAVIGVPTPMNHKTGQCNTSIVEDAIAKHRDRVDIFLVKSTVEIGTCERLEKKYNIPVCMSPEYVGETVGHPLLEPRRDAFQIIGGNELARSIVAEYFMRVLHADAQMILVTSKEAEIIKYCENYWIMRRVDFWNEVFQIGASLNADFQALRNGLTADPRLNRTHSNVYKNNRGWSGKCLPKDMNALAYKMRKAGNPLYTLEHLIEKNAKLWREGYNDSNKLIPDNPVWKDGKNYHDNSTTDVKGTRRIKQ